MSAVVEEVTPSAEPTPEQVQADAVQAFDAGFQPVDPTATPETAEGEVTPAETETVKAEPPPPPEYVQVTKQDFESLMDARKTVTELKSKIDQGFGSLGGKMSSLEKKLLEAQKQTPAGEPLSLTDEDLAEIRKDYPELATVLKTDLGKIFGRLKGTGKSDAFDAAKMEELLNARTNPLTADQRELALDVMDTWREDWHPTVTGEKFQGWLLTQPEDYRKTVSETWKPSVMKAAIRKFDTDTAPPPEKTPGKPKGETPDPQRSRLKAAVQPKGDGQASHASGSEDPDVAFDAGFDERHPKERR